MQFYTMAIINAVSQLVQIPVIQKIFSGMVSTIISGVCLYWIYRIMDSRRAHKSTNHREWTKLPNGIWYSNVTMIGSVAHRKLVFGGLSKDDNQSLSRPSHIKLEMYVDFPVSMESTPIEAQGKTLVFGYTRVEDFLPLESDDCSWTVTREERRKSPLGYIREKIELVAPIH